MIKTRILLVHWFDRGIDNGWRTAGDLRLILNSLSDDEINEEYSQLPRMILVRPFLDRYELLMAA